MAFFSALRIAGSALTAQRLRTDVIANNVANMNTTRTAEGGAYRRQQVIFNPRQEHPTFKQLLLSRAMINLPGAPFIPTGLGNAVPGTGVTVSSVGPDGRPGKRVFEPDHPDANIDGFVEYPDIDPVTEMADMLSATRAYEASVTTLNAAKGMAMKALEIGR
ncbi:MAG: flagellar basal body rod protein FlgC [Chloroflexota bacterium]